MSVAVANKRTYVASEHFGENHYTFRSRWDHMFARHLQSLVRSGTLYGWQYKPAELTYWAGNSRKTQKADFNFKMLYKTGQEAYIYMRVHRAARFDMKEVQRYYKEYSFIEVDKTFFDKNKDRLEKNKIWIE